MSNKNQTQTDAQMLATMRDMMKVQQGNQALREKELSVEQERIKSNEKIALASIQAQKEDRLAQMSVISKFEMIKYIFGGGISIGIFAVIGYAMYSGNTQFAIELAKLIVPLIVGLIGGYGLGKHKSNNQKDEKNVEE